MVQVEDFSEGLNNPPDIKGITNLANTIAEQLSLLQAEDVEVELTK